MSKAYIFSLVVYQAFQENMLYTAEIGISSVGIESNFYFYSFVVLLD